MATLPVMYIDVVWLINWIMDTFILLLTAWMLKRPVRWLRVSFASAVGASYAVLLFFPLLSGWEFSLIVKVLVSILMVWLVFSPRVIVDGIRVLFVFYFASFVTGGTSYGMLSLLGSNLNVASGMLFVSGNMIWRTKVTMTFFFAIPVIWALGKSVWSRIERIRVRANHLCRVHFMIDGHQLYCTGLVDTGNSLADPLSGDPVAIIEWEVLADILPDRLRQCYEKGQDPLLQSEVLSSEAEWLAKCRFIPYKGVGGSVGILITIRPDRFEVEQDGLLQICGSLWIGIQSKGLSSDRSYQVILPPACLVKNDEHAQVPVLHLPQLPVRRS